MLKIAACFLFSILTHPSFSQNKIRPLLVADDAAGGFYALNGGGLGKDLGKIYYLSPDNLQWEAMEFMYSDFIQFCLNGNLELYYSGLRWKDWKKETANLDGSNVYSFFPYLWTKE